MGILSEKDKINSSMRIAFLMVVITACMVALGAVAGLILSIVLHQELTAIGSILGGLAGIIGSLLVPAFGGKSLQKFAEGNQDTTETENPDIE